MPINEEETEMSSKIELNVNQYGDELLTLYVNGEYEAALDMYTVVQKAAQEDKSTMQTLIALHLYKNERIVDKTVAHAAVDCVHTLRAQGHPKFAAELPRRSYNYNGDCEEKKEALQQWVNGLITQSELSNKLKSLDSQ